MQKLTLFYLPECPHCRLAMRLIDELAASEPRYAEIPIERIDERANKALAETYDYWYVPCFFAGRKKLFEGHMELDDVKRVLEAALAE